MDERQIYTHETEGVDLQKAVAAIFGKMWLIILISILCAAISFAGTYFLITPQYESSALFYVNNNSLSLGDASLSIDSGDISASKSLVNSYIVILKSRETINDVIEHAQVNRSYVELKDMITATSVNNTEIFEVVVTSPSPTEAQKIAMAITEVLPDRIGGIIEGTSAKIVDYAVVPSSPSSPSYTVNVIVGFLIGLVLSVGIVLVQEIFDVRIRTEEDLAEISQMPILASVPDMTAASKGAYEYRRGSKAKKTKKLISHKNVVLVGSEIGFTAAEAYKLLRTKLQFSFSDEGNCRVIGVSSSLSGEGKSITAVNLAYTLAQLNKRVILIDCDMRRPTVAEKLNLKKNPGLSSYLTAQCQLGELVQESAVQEGEVAFRVISAGQCPPNPAELLSSARMGQMLEMLRNTHDYVILDLPPVIEVSDALAVANQTDGMLLVVRQNMCDRNVLSDTLRQFEYVDAKLLGVVFNCIGAGNGKGYYRKYYKGYYRKYSHGHYQRGYYSRQDSHEE